MRRHDQRRDRKNTAENAPPPGPAAEPWRLEILRAKPPKERSTMDKHAQELKATQAWVRRTGPLP